MCLTDPVVRVARAGVLGDLCLLSITSDKTAETKGTHTEFTNAAEV